MNTKHRHCMFVIFIVFSIFLWLKIPVYSELTGTVTGKVMDEETGKGIKGVLIFLQSVGKKRDFRRSYRSETDNNGSFTIFEVEAGIYRIGFCPPSPYAWAKVTPDNSTDEKITVENGKTLTVFKRLRVGGTVEARTFELPSKKPLAGVAINLYGVDNRLLMRGKGRLTDSNGKLGTDGLDEGKYTLDARLAGYGMKFIEYEIKLKETTVIEIPFDSNSTTGVFGYVKCQQDGTPLVGIGVGVDREDKYGWVDCFTDKNGFYSAIDLEPGKYTIDIVGINPNEKTEDDYNASVFISKPVTVIPGEKMQINFNLDCSIEYRK